MDVVRLIPESETETEEEEEEDFEPPMSLRINILTTGKLPALEDAQRLLTDKQALNSAIAGTVGGMVRRYIQERSQSPAYHKTADRLGAKRTGYYEAASTGVQTSGNSTEATVLLTQHTEIFKRVEGPVSVKPRTRQWLSIAATKEGYGRRAEELGGLSFRPTSRPGLALLVRGPKYQRKADGTRRTKAEALAYRKELAAQTKVIYWLRKSVILPQDRQLLPSQEQVELAAELGAKDAINMHLKKL